MCVSEGGCFPLCSPQPTRRLCASLTYCTRTGLFPVSLCRTLSLSPVSFFFFSFTFFSFLLLLLLPLSCCLSCTGSPHCSFPTVPTQSRGQRNRGVFPFTEDDGRTLDKNKKQRHKKRQGIELDKYMRDMWRMFSTCACCRHAREASFVHAKTVLGLCLIWKSETIEENWSTLLESVWECVLTALLVTRLTVHFLLQWKSQIVLIGSSIITIIEPKDETSTKCRQYAPNGHCLIYYCESRFKWSW